MTVRTFQDKDTKQVAILITETFSKYNSDDYFDENAAKTYQDQFDLKVNSIESLNQLFKTSHIFFVAEEDNKIIGVIRGRADKISNLFVDSKQHKKGIGKQLIQAFEKEAVKQSSTEINIKSTICATPFYQKMGYIKKSGIINFMGLKVILMNKQLD